MSDLTAKLERQQKLLQTKIEEASTHKALHEQVAKQLTKSESEVSEFCFMLYCIQYLYFKHGTLVAIPVLNPDHVLNKIFRSN